MSKNNTMTSDILSQQQQNLQHLQHLELQRKSLTSNFDTTSYTSRNSIRPVVNTSSPLVIQIPVDGQPTEVLAARFGAWRQVIRSILVYLTEVAAVQEEIVRQHQRLNHAVSFPFFSMENQHQPEDGSVQRFFLPLGNGSVQDIPTVLSQYHNNYASMASRTSRELTNNVIPRLEELRRDLLVKIKEIKSLASDFKNTCAKEIAQTKVEYNAYLNSLEQAKFSNSKVDPYLTKVTLDRQIKRQLTEENFLHEAYNNLQNSGKELEKVVVVEIQNALTTFARLVGQEAQLVFDALVSKIDVGFLSKEPTFEWDNFIGKETNFVDPQLPMRKFGDILYKNQNDPLTLEVRNGFLERRSKFLKSYSRGFYVLTPSFIHEFKTGDRKKDIVPVMSLSLDDCTVAEHSKRESNDFKFVLHARQNGIINRGHNWVFRADSYDEMMGWYNDIKKLTSLRTGTERGIYAAGKMGRQTPSMVISPSPDPEMRRVSTYSVSSFPDTVDSVSYKPGEPRRSFQKV